MTLVRFPIDIAFKGDRTYLQSADIFDSIIANTGASRNLKLQFRRILSHKIEAVDASAVDQPEACPARFTGEGDNGAFDLLIVDDPTTEIAARVPYDEPRVIRDSHIEGSQISSQDGQDASVMERVVALNKHLIHSTVKPGKKLLFSSANLISLPARTAHLTVRLESRLGVRLFKSSIHVGADRVGEIIFYGV